MDLSSLTASHLAARKPPALTNPGAEARYWRQQAPLPRPALRLLASLATIAGVVLLLVGSAQL